MEKRTKKRRYNTGGATVICCADVETLYRKTNGEYFIATPDSITPIGYDEAKDWTEAHAAPEVYDAYFGTVSMGGEKTTCSFRLSTGTVELLKREAGKTGEKLSDVVERAVWFLLT